MRKSFTQKTEQILCKVFGPQFYIGNLSIKPRNNRNTDLCWTDSLYKRKLIWSSEALGCLSLAFLKTEDMTNVNCLKKYLDNSSDKTKYNLYYSIQDENTNLFLHPDSINELEKREIESASLKYKNNRYMYIETENYYIYPKFLRAGVTVYGYLNKKDLLISKPSFYWLLAIIATLSISLYLIVYSWNIIILKKIDRLSIKWKLVYLFIFANGLPLLVLIFIGNEYLQKARFEHTQKIMVEGTKFLQDFDEKYELEYARCIIRKDKFKTEILNKHKNILDKKDSKKLFNMISSDTWVLYLIASSGQTLFTNEDDSYDEEDFYEASPKNKHKFSTKKRRGMILNVSDAEFKRINSQFVFSKKLGHYLLNQLNNQPIEEKDATEVELVLETTIRKKIDSFIFDLMGKIGGFVPIGFGHNVHRGILDVISLNSSSIYDYFMLSTIRTVAFQMHYLEKSIIQANRNNLGLKLITWNSENGYIPKSQYDNSIGDLFNQLTSYPLEQAVIVKYENQDYIAMGFSCKHIEKCKILGLYPLESIDRQVSLKKKELIAICLLSFLMTIFLSSIIIRSFLKPLSAIYNGARSIEQKNFQHHLPELGRDEFGEIGKIFNDVIVDLEELSVAKTIQEQLLPNSTINSGSFSIYGKSVAMSELGGDYFDFLEMENNEFSVAFGDVAGHGVGASLIMAMAKAGLISLDIYWREPQKLISKLHEMIYKSKTKKQRKIMTFQYMFLNGLTGQAIYSNAGGCSPVIIRKSTGEVEDLVLSGAVLGAFKKSKYLEKTIQFNDGDAVVFYTDGIVECKNNQGVMLGYDNLKLIFQKSWNSEAKTFYNNIYKNYLEYIGGSENKANDDVTIVVLVFNKQISTQ